MASKDKKQPEKRDDSGKSEIMHRLKTHPFLFIGTVVILVIVIIAFVFVPAIVPSAQYETDLIFGYYNKTPVKYALNNYFYQIQQSLARNQQPSQDDPNYLYMTYSIWKYAYDEAVVQIGILDEMKQAGYETPEKIVDREVARQFHENGRFDATRYRALDNATRMSMWRQVKDSIAVDHYISDMTGIRSSSYEASFIAAMSSPQRNFNVAIFPISSYPDSEIISYAQTNPSLFRMVHLSKITITSSEREARLIMDSVRNGTSTFEEAAVANSQDEYADRGGDMGIRMAYELMFEISDEQARESVINLPRGGISDLVRVSYGWIFYRAEEAARPADTNDFAQVEKIRNYIMTYMRGRAEDWLNDEAQRFSALARETGFDEAIFIGNRLSGTFGPIPINYGNSALFNSVSSSGIPELANAGSNLFFWRAAFSTPVNTPSDPLVIGDNVVVLYPLEEFQADESEIDMIVSYFPYYIADNTLQVYKSHFLNNAKLDDRFENIFWRLMGY